MRKPKTFVVDLRKIKPVHGVKDYQKNFAYHGGGASYRGFANTELGRETIRDQPRWVRKEAKPYTNLINRKFGIRLELLRLGQKKGQQMKQDKLIKELSEIQAKLNEGQQTLVRKLEKGSFESPYGKLSEKDVFNASVQSFAEGVLSSELAFLKDKAIHNKGARGTIELVRKIGDRKTRLSELFKKPVAEITEEDVKKKIGDGRVFENDLLMVKAMRGTLKREEIQNASKTGIIGKDEKAFYDAVFNVTNNFKNIVYADKGINESFGIQNILIETKPADFNKKRHFPVFFGILP